MKLNNVEIDNYELSSVYYSIDNENIFNKIQNEITSTICKQGGEVILIFRLKKIDTNKFTWTILDENANATFRTNNKGNQLTYKSLRQTKIDLSNYIKLNLISNN